MVDLSKDEMYQLLGDQLDREYFSSPIERLRQRMSNAVAEVQARRSPDAKPGASTTEASGATGSQTTLVLKRLINEHEAEPEVEVPTITRGGIVTAPSAEEAEPVSAEKPPTDVFVQEESKAEKAHHGHKKHDKRKADKDKKRKKDKKKDRDKDRKREEKDRKRKHGKKGDRA